MLCIVHNPRVLGSIVLRSEKYFWEVWEVFLGGLGSIEFDTKYLRVPCLIVTKLLNHQVNGVTSGVTSVKNSTLGDT